MNQARQEHDQKNTFQPRLRSAGQTEQMALNYRKKQAERLGIDPHQIDLKNGYAFEIEAYNRMVPTEDRLEGVRAFNEKRKAEFKGR